MTVVSSLTDALNSVLVRIIVEHALAERTRFLSDFAAGQGVAVLVDEGERIAVEVTEKGFTVTNLASKAGAPPSSSSPSPASSREQIEGIPDGGPTASIVIEKLHCEVRLGQVVNFALDLDTRNFSDLVTYFSLLD